MGERLIPLLRRIYADINAALWSALAAGIFLFAVVTLPHIKENAAAYRMAQDADVSAENDLYCRRWKFIVGTAAYRSCLDDLNALRASIEKRLAEQDEF
jgi:hypothetical protein